MFELLGDVEDYEDILSGSDFLVALTEQPPGPMLLSGLMELDVATLSPDEALTYAQQWDRAAAWVAGMQVTVMAGAFAQLTENAAEADLPSRFVVPEQAASAEAAAALRISPRTADARVCQAQDLIGPMKPLHDALTGGEVSLGHVSAIRHELLRLPAAGHTALADQFAQQCARVLEVVVPYAATHTPGQAAKKTRMLVTAVDPEGTRERRREITERSHGVFLRETEPGACELTAVMPTAHGHAVLSAINILAHDERFQTADGCITLGQRRVAAMVQLMLGDPGSVGQVTGPVAEAKLTAHVEVVVPLATMMAARGHAQGGTINGEPVPADVLWELFAQVDADSTLRRLVVDGNCCIVDAGRTRYVISETQRRIIQLRDRTCRFPGCNQPARRCDVDHATSYADGGNTDLENLGPLCRRHHQLKTHSKWRIISSKRNGECTWKSPLGRIYHHEPPPLLPPPPLEQYDFQIGPTPF